MGTYSNNQETQTCRDGYRKLLGWQQARQAHAANLDQARTTHHDQEEGKLQSLPQGHQRI